MLNEKKEYTLLLTPGYGNLLRRDNLKNNLSGIRHPLTVLARGFLALCENEGVDSLSEKERLCREFLSCWTIGCQADLDGTPKNIAKEFEKAQKCSLLEYIVSENMKLRCLKDASRETVHDYLSKKIESWKKHMFYSFKENSVNEIYFRTIIADAIHKGPLTNKVLVIKGNIEKYGISGSKEALKHLNEILAIVGICLQNLSSGQCSANVKLVQLSNYLNKPPSQKNKRGSAFSCMDGFFEDDAFTYNGRPIITKKELAGGVVKFLINPIWIADLDVKLADYNEKITPDYYALGDSELLPKRF